MKQILPGLIAGGLLGAGAGGTWAYLNRQAENDSIEDIIQRNPEGATYRDVIGDPIHQAELDRKAMMTAAMRPRYHVGAGLFRW